MKGVFDIEPGSPWGDRLAERYYFGSRSDYLAVAEATVGDWILYRESKRGGGRKGYVGAARVISIEKDEAGSRYANIADYFAFDPPVPLKDSAGAYREELFRGVTDPRLIGHTFQGKSLRLISEDDFEQIVQEALGEVLSPANLVRYGANGDEYPEPIGQPDTATLDQAFVRRIETSLVNRKVRAANFRRLICRAYNDTCAVTGLRIINGGGRSEVQAAHIWSVESGGPDAVQNGLALSGTVHWLFDRHLISISPEFRLLVADNRIPTELRGLFPDPMSPILLPKDRALWPSQDYVQRHRDAFVGA